MGANVARDGIRTWLEIEEDVAGRDVHTFSVTDSRRTRPGYPT